jgi:hypothetical protein
MTTTNTINKISDALKFLNMIRWNRIENYENDLGDLRH